jgi:hypothetical protein
MYTLYMYINCLQVKLQNYLMHFNVYGSVHHNNIPIHIQQDATLHSLFYLETALHVSGGTSTHHQERKQLYLQHLVFVSPLLLPAAIVDELELLWYHSKHVEQFPDKINCVTLHLVGYILEYLIHISWDSCMWFVMSGRMEFSYVKV